MANWIAYIFGDDTATVTLTSNGSITSAPIDASMVFNADATNPSSISLTLTGTTSGNVTVDTSRDGVNDWVQSHTEAHTGGAVSINGTTALNGFASFFRVTVTDTSTTAGTVKGHFEGQTP